MKSQLLNEKQSLKEFFKSGMTIRYAILALLAFANAMYFASNHYTDDNPFAFLPALSVLIPIYFVLNYRVISPLAIGSLMSVVLTVILPQMQFY